MTINELIDLLEKQKQTLGGDAKVVAMWDCAVADLNEFGIQNGALIFDVEDYASSEVEFDYMGFERI